MLLLFLFSQIEYRITKPAAKRNASARAKNNYFLHSIMELMVIFDIFTIGLLTTIFFKQLNANHISIFSTIIILSVSISMRGTWLSNNTEESYRLEREEEKHAKDELFPSVRKTIEQSSNPDATSIPHERNPALDIGKSSEPVRNRKQH